MISAPLLPGWMSRNKPSCSATLCFHVFVLLVASSSFFITVWIKQRNNPQSLATGDVIQSTDSTVKIIMSCLGNDASARVVCIQCFFSLQPLSTSLIACCHLLALTNSTATGMTLCIGIEMQRSDNLTLYCGLIGRWLTRGAAVTLTWYCSSAPSLSFSSWSSCFMAACRALSLARRSFSSSCFSASVSEMARCCRRWICSSSALLVDSSSNNLHHTHRHVGKGESRTVLLISSWSGTCFTFRLNRGACLLNEATDPS